MLGIDEVEVQLPNDFYGAQALECRMEGRVFADDGRTLHNIYIYTPK